VGGKRGENAVAGGGRGVLVESRWANLRQQHNTPASLGRREGLLSGRYLRRYFS
jgi:hypothetical protein